jgi:hypothetical protein
MRFAKVSNMPEPQAQFTVHFKLNNMGPKVNRIFSLLPMVIMLGFKGFTSKYWLVKTDTNEYMGVYQWSTSADAKHYSQSIAAKFIQKRSAKGSFNFTISQIDL